MGNTIKFAVVTPEKKVLEGTAESVVIPTHDGELGILPDRASLMCELGTGQMRYRQGTATYRLFIDGGFAQVHDNNVIVLTKDAVAAKDISDEMVAAADTALAEAPTQTIEDQEQRIHLRRRANVLHDLHP